MMSSSWSPFGTRVTLTALIGLLFLAAGGGLLLAQAGDFKEVSQDGFTLRWRVAGENLEVEAEAEATGWIAVGFEPSRRMKDANIIMGYDSGNEQRVTDQFGVRSTGHRLDTEIGGSDDLLESEVRQNNGRTVLRFTIPLDSGDDADQPLVPGEQHTIIMAHGPANTDDFTTYHGGNRTILQVEL